MDFVKFCIARSRILRAKKKENYICKASFNVFNEGVYKGEHLTSFKIYRKDLLRERERGGEEKSIHTKITVEKRPIYKRLKE